VTGASFSTAGTYVLRLSAIEGPLTSTDDVTVTVNELSPTGSVIARAHASEGTLTDPMSVFATISSGAA
jgi:hypothetical protein